ncbi:hypothetical protein PY247_11230 [Acinetobacter proteolyticus]|nr:hypothetical protein [Acinetobacter proteolyticus]WEI17133.1 hypothetical protein PY247_11230 [Acinetobacter proteolyticus]
MNFDIEQLDPNTTALFVKFDSKQICSSHQHEKLREQFSQTAQATGLKVFAVDHQMTIEQLSDTDLAAIGLQRIKEHA